MDWLNFIASLVASLAWPLTAVVVAVMFRRAILQLLSTGLRRLKAGPFEAEWSLAESKVPSGLRLAAHTSSLDLVEAETARISPQTAVLERYNELISLLADQVTKASGQQPEGQSVGDLIEMAAEAGVINASTKQALLGVSVMRNLAAHGGHDMDEEKAAQFVVMADAVEFAMRSNGSA